VLTFTNCKIEYLQQWLGYVLRKVEILRCGESLNLREPCLWAKFQTQWTRHHVYWCCNIPCYCLEAELVVCVGYFDKLRLVVNERKKQNHDIWRITSGFRTVRQCLRIRIIWKTSVGMFSVH
jgi:hypothetical protein